MFERYTEAARRTLFYARWETARLGGTTIEVEHILLALIREGQGVNQDLFSRAHLSYENVEAEIRARSASLEKVAPSVEIPFSAATKRVLQYAVEEADRLVRQDIEPEHLLLGVLREEHSFAAAILQKHALHLAHARDAVVNHLSVRTSTTSGAPAPSALVARAFGANVDVGGQIEAVKRVVRQLGEGRTVSPAAHDLVERIQRDLDALKQILH